MKIDYTKFLENNNTKETNIEKVKRMKKALVYALKANKIHGRIHCEYYTDGIVSVSINGQYFNLFDSTTESFFSGFVGN